MRIYCLSHTCNIPCPSAVFPSDFQSKIMYAFIVSYTCNVPCPIYILPSGFPSKIMYAFNVSYTRNIPCPSAIFRSGFLSKIMYTFIVSLIHVTHPVHLSLSLFHFITATISGNSLQHSATSFLLGPNHCLRCSH